MRPLGRMPENRDAWELSATPLALEAFMYLALSIFCAFALLIWFLGSFLVWKTQDAAIFPGTGRSFGPHPELLPLRGEAKEARHEGEVLRWYEFGANDARAALLLFHGNADGAFERLDFVEALQPWGIRVFLAEFPGYAGESGPTREWAVLHNALAIYDFLWPQFQSFPLFLMGESLGTGPATYVASLRRPKGLLLSTPYPSMADVAKSKYPWVPIHHLIRHPMKAKFWAPAVACPVLILHGNRDRTVPYRLGQAQSKNFRNLAGFETIEGARHSDIRSMRGGRFWKACLNFIDEQLAGEAN